MSNNNNQSEEKEAIQQNDLIEPELEEKLSELEILRQSLDEKKKKADEYLNQVLRLQADFDNYRKRVEKEKTEFIKFSNEKIIIKILSLFDDLERAKKAVEDSSDMETLILGIGLIHKNFMSFLKQEGVKEIKSLAEMLDPNKHHVVLQVDSDEYENNQIIEELQKGYTFNGKVIRPAMVKVARKKSKEQEEEEKELKEIPEKLEDDRS